jgi:hypothetical protein
MLEALFGSATAERVLLYLQVYEQGYVRGIASTFELPVSQVQAQLVKFEDAGLLVSSTVGRTRLYVWNPRNPFVAPLRALLEEIVRALPEAEVRAYFRERRRPRKAGKPL